MTDAQKKTAEILENIKKDIQNVKTEEGVSYFLKIATNNHNYSLNNRFAIARQCGPDTGMVRGYRQWQKEFDRQVIKGSRGAKILVPLIMKDKRVKVKEGEEERKRIFFKSVSVFSYKQTEGKELPFLENQSYYSDPQNFSDFLLKNKETIFPEYTFTDDILTENVGGYCIPSTKSITININRSNEMQAKTIIHEIAHGELHHNSEKELETKEIEAEATAYAVSQKFGLDTSDYSLKYIANYFAKRDDIELSPILKGITSKIDELYGRINEAIKEQTKETVLIVEKGDNEYER